MFSHCTTAAQLKAEYHRLALRHHPDRGGDPQMFIRINQQMKKRLQELAEKHDPGIEAFLTPEIKEKLVTVGFGIIDQAVATLKETLIKNLVKPG